MSTKTLDIRQATCPGGGAIWAFLSHIREVPLGGDLELLTDDPMAQIDIPDWADWEGWTVVEREDLLAFTRFVVRRPLEGAVTKRLRQETGIVR